MKVLITRAHEDAAALADLLQAHGIAALIDPLLTIDWSEGPPLDVRSVQALLMTSANGVRAFCRRNRERHLAVYAVGDATAQEAMAQGFSQVKTAAGDVAALAALVRQQLSPDGGSLLHCAGTRLAGDLGGELSHAGYGYRREVLYAARASEQLSPDTVAGLQAGQLDGVLLYSPRTAAIFSACIGRAGLQPALSQVTAYCLSPAVGEGIRDLPWQFVAVAKSPTQTALLEIVLARI
ncbi:MAG: uroporphyrinogen-III synthase [Rhodospirillales bacterium]|nr:uroporphyrinogen-III synthase [Rhodospirillales bacterium]